MKLSGKNKFMEQFELKKNPQLKIETVKTPEGNEVSCCPERGGIITSLKLNGKEVLYLDQETFQNREVNVKGGIPVLFPNAGPMPDETKTEELKNLKQHGFARESKWDYQKGANGFTETLSSDEKSKEVYPYDFRLSLNGSFEENGSFTVAQTVENHEKEKEMPISSGFHPYFKVQSSEKKNIKFDFPGGEKVEEQIEKWANGKAVSIENTGDDMKVNIPELGTLVFKISKEYKRLWVWSMKGKDFVCIEPFMRGEGGIVLDPEIIKPGEKIELSFNLAIK